MAHAPAQAVEGAADALADFYCNHPLTIWVGSSEEGAYGIYARALSRHLPRHLPGNPQIVIKFMAEGAGLRLTNELATILPRDGSVIAALRGSNAVESLLNPGPEVAYDARALAWIGCVSRQTGTIITWHSSDLKTLEDCRRREVVVGAEAPDANIATLPNILNGLLGTKFRTVPGYTRQGLRGALESGAIDCICGFGYNSLLAAHADWLDGHKLNFLAHTGVAPDHPLMPAVPSTLSLAATEDDRNVIRLMDYRQVLGRPYAAPPGLPADRLAALRQAFAATMLDPAFLADAKQHNLLVDPLGPEDMVKIIEDAYAMAPEIVTRTWRLLSGESA